MLRTDCGTETGLMAALHCFLHQNSDAHRFVKSVANQRIENWWSHLRKHYTSWLISFFKGLVFDGHYHLGNYVHEECAWFVFRDLIQSDLDRIRYWWNSHFIRKSQHNTVSGIPDDLYFLPEGKGFCECGKSVNIADFDRIGYNAFDAQAESIMYRKDEDLTEYFNYTIVAEGLCYPPQRWDEAKTIFIKISQISGYQFVLQYLSLYLLFPGF